MLHIFNSLKSGRTVGKNVCSRLVLGKMCSNIERCVFRASLYGAHFLYLLSKEKIYGQYLSKRIARESQKCL